MSYIMAMHEAVSVLMNYNWYIPLSGDLDNNYQDVSTNYYDFKSTLKHISQ